MAWAWWPPLLWMVEITTQIIHQLRFYKLNIRENPTLNCAFFQQIILVIRLVIRFKSWIIYIILNHEVTRSIKLLSCKSQENQPIAVGFFISAFNSINRQRHITACLFSVIRTSRLHPPELCCFLHGRNGCRYQALAPSMFAQSQRLHQWSRCCGC